MIDLLDDEVFSSCEGRKRMREHQRELADTLKRLAADRADNTTFRLMFMLHLRDEIEAIDRRLTTQFILDWGPLVFILVMLLFAAIPVAMFVLFGN